MKEQYEIQAIAHIVTDFSSKFGIPRQSGLVEELEGKILFEPEYGTKEAVKGLEEFSHIWLIWGFSENRRKLFPDGQTTEIRRKYEKRSIFNPLSVSSKWNGIILCSVREDRI